MYIEYETTFVNTEIKLYNLFCLLIPGNSILFPLKLDVDSCTLSTVPLPMVRHSTGTPFPSSGRYLCSVPYRTVLSFQVICLTKKGVTVPYNALDVFFLFVFVCACVISACF
jgi:hypothetical protein